MAATSSAANWLRPICWCLLAIAGISNALPKLQTISYDLRGNISSIEHVPRTLLKRALTPVETRTIYNQASTTTVDTNAQGYLDCSTGPYPKYIGTAGLNGCTGIAICNDQGCALIHVLPDELPTPTYKWRTLIQQSLQAHPDLAGSSAVLAAYTSVTGHNYQWEIDQIQSYLQNNYQITSSIGDYWEYYGTEEYLKDMFDGDGEMAQFGPLNMIENEAMGLMLVVCNSATDHAVYIAGVSHS